MSNFKKIHLHGTRVKQKGKKGYRKRKYIGGMWFSKHRTSWVGTNHTNCIDRVREYNLEEERYKELKKKRNIMYESIMELFKIKRKFY